MVNRDYKQRKRVVYPRVVVLERTVSHPLDAPAGTGKGGNLIRCKDCAHLCYEDLGVYYCGLHRIAGQLNPDDQGSCGKRKEEQRNAATD